MFRFSHLLKVTAVIACALAVLAAGVSGALAAGSADNLEQIQAKLRECVKTLREIDAERRDADTMLTLAERSKIVLINDNGSLIPIDMDTWSLFADFQLRAGIITQGRYDQILRRLTNGRARTLRVLRSIVAELERERDEQDQICAFLVKQRDRLKAGGGDTSKPAVGAFPGGTATELTFTIGGATVTTVLKTNQYKDGQKQPTIKAKLGTTLDGKVELNGTLPPGWVVAVTQTGSEVLLNSPTGGTFSVTYAFDANTHPGAYICSTKVPPICSSASYANITIDWDP